jgi:protein-S-isoprenylcysteine O-methyltransferase Ste14
MTGWAPFVFFERHPEWNENGLAPHEWAALPLGVAGLWGYLVCAWHFARKGRGTVAPWDGPRKLVQRGLYRWVRNPMYISLGLILLSEAVYFESWRIALYLLCMSCVAQLFVVLHEEPEMSFRFGAMYEDYKRVVPRWFPRRPQPSALELDPSSAER